ncbi:Shedu immune nuclease family protein [Bacillus sp. 1P02SD]|uniref:Shedu immune nuclease family protein n=1 Tax=Bacillus sp. 1P02SD TaxID=3132264 RepID=UPI0039A3CDC9
MVSFIKRENILLLEYESGNGVKWIFDRFNEGYPCRIKRTFTFREEDVFYDDDEIDNEHQVLFKIGTLDGEYYKINGEVLEIDINVYIEKNIDLNKEMFIAYQNISIFKRISMIVREDIRIGNGEEDLPITVFKELIKKFPNTTEMKQYYLARISSVVKDYFDNSIDAEVKYENYMNRYVESHIGESLLNKFAEQEKLKYLSIQDKLEEMLENEVTYSEKQWQIEILDIIQLIYPKYVKAFSEVGFKDIYQNKTRRLDFLLVDTNGNIDIVEIKKPFNRSIVSHRKYRDNHIPLKELSGSVMQVEKYLFYLNKWSRKGEEELNRKYASELPKDLEIKITNPSGMIIMGREKNLTPEQLWDFEIIKRQYKNVIDILSYDELIARLEQIVNKFSGD